jgi:hypothetical protein
MKNLSRKNTQEKQVKKGGGRDMKNKYRTGKQPATLDKAYGKIEGIK